MPWRSVVSMPNRILTLFRSRVTDDDAAWRAADWAHNIDDEIVFGRYSQTERDEARRVLLRLSSFWDSREKESPSMKRIEMLAHRKMPRGEGEQA